MRSALLLCVTIWLGACGAQAGNASSDFDAANRLYEQGNFREATVAYQKMLAGGERSAAVYFNLGNAYFKAGELGRAVAAYRQAERLNPRDPDLRANLQFARNQVQGPSSTVPGWQKWLGRLTLNEWTWLTMAAFWVLLGLLAAGQWRPGWRRSLGTPVMISIVALAVFGACLGIEWSVETGSKVAVVVSNDAVVRLGPLDEAQTAFTVHDGSEMQVLDQKGDWLQVRTDPRRAGWVRKDQVLLAPGVS